MSTKLQDAARAVLKRWDSPQWEWSYHGPTAGLMADLRAALAADEAREPVAPYGWVSKHTTPGLYEWQFDKELAAVYRDTAIFIVPVYEHSPAAQAEQPAQTAYAPLLAFHQYMASRAEAVFGAFGMEAINLLNEAEKAVWVDDDRASPQPKEGA